MLGHSSFRHRRHRGFLPTILLGVWVVASPAPAPARELSGHVTDRSGTPIEGVTVITSGMGFNGWATSKANGSFELRATGAFVSFRHQLYKPLFVRTSDLTAPVEVRLDPIDETVWKPKWCGSLFNNRARIGDRLRIDAGGGYEGPVHGEHNTHWYVRRGGDQLHIVNGYVWHAGLPPERTLYQSEWISVRGWIFGDTVGFDLSGRSREGKYWRWVGAPLAEAIEYETSSRKVAGDFDKIIATMCFLTRQSKP